MARREGAADVAEVGCTPEVTSPLTRARTCTRILHRQLHAATATAQHSEHPSRSSTDREKKISTHRFTEELPEPPSTYKTNVDTFSRDFARLRQKEGTCKEKTSRLPSSQCEFPVSIGHDDLSEPDNI